MFSDIFLSFETGFSVLPIFLTSPEGAYLKAVKSPATLVSFLVPSAYVVQRETPFFPLFVIEVALKTSASL